MSKKVSVDPFSMSADDSPSEGCFQTWSDERNISKYPVLDLKKGEGKCYPSPKERKSFLERMKERDEKQTRMRFSSKAVKNLFQNKGEPKVAKKDSIEELNVSPKMKKFIKKEFRREKLKYNFLPEKQVKLQVIHRYKVHIRNSEMKMPKPKQVAIRKTKAKPRKSLKSQRLNEDSDDEVDKIQNTNKEKHEPQTSTGTKNIAAEKKSMHFNKNCLEDSEDDDSFIEEFDDANLSVMPAPGAFQICPNKRQRSAVKKLVVCYHADSDSDNIVDSSQESKDQTVKFYKDITKEGSLSPSPRKKGPKLPYLMSSSPNTEGKHIRLVDGEDTIEGDDMKEIDSKIKVEFLKLERCYNCLSRKDDLLSCSACNKVTYCNQSCQLNDWAFHRNFCRKIKSEIEMSSQETEQILLAHLNNAVNQSKKKEHIPKYLKSLRLAKKRTNIDRDHENVKKSVKFLSQPEYEPQAKPTFQKTPAKRILKRTTKHSVVQNNQLREETNGQIQDAWTGEIKNKSGVCRGDLEEKIMENKSVQKIVSYSELEEDSPQHIDSQKFEELAKNEEIEIPDIVHTESDNVLDNDAGNELEQFPTDDNLPDDQDSPSKAKSLLSNTPENSPQTERKILSMGAFAPKSSGKRSVSRTNPKKINSIGKPIKLFNNLEGEDEELEISITQNEEENDQSEIYLQIPKKLSFDDIEEDCAGKGTNFDDADVEMENSEYSSNESKIQENQPGISENELQSSSSFLSFSSVDLDFGEYFSCDEDENKRRCQSEREHILPTADVGKNEDLFKDDELSKIEECIEATHNSSLDMFIDIDTEEVITKENEETLNNQAPVLNPKGSALNDVPPKTSENGSSSPGFLDDMFSDEDEAQRVNSSGGSSMVVGSAEESPTTNTESSRILATKSSGEFSVL